MEKNVENFLIFSFYIKIHTPDEDLMCFHI